MTPEIVPTPVLGRSTHTGTNAAPPSASRSCQPEPLPPASLPRSPRGWGIAPSNQATAHRPSANASPRDSRIRWVWGTLQSCHSRRAPDGSDGETSPGTLARGPPPPQRHRDWLRHLRHEPLHRRPATRGILPAEPSHLSPPPDKTEHLSVLVTSRIVPPPRLTPGGGGTEERG